MVVDADVAWSVCLSVCVCVGHSPAKMAQHIEMPFEGICVDPKNRVFDWGAQLHISATWRMRWNDLCSLAMRSFVTTIVATCLLATQVLDTTNIPVTKNYT